ncbi:MAG TPA: glycosyltransferase, partial [Terriglobales bacterium]|nr:glycosyltransferase [Terriglobales bacterium]
SHELAERGHRMSVVLIGPSEDGGWETALPGLRVGPMAPDWREVRDDVAAAIRIVARALSADRPEVVLVTEPAGALLVRLSAVIRWIRRPAIVSWVHGDVTRIHHSWAARFCDGHLAISRGIADQLKTLSRSPVSLVYNPIALPELWCRRPNRSNDTKFLFIGRLERQKRVDRILVALSKVPSVNWTCDVIGDGALRAELEALAVVLAISDRVRWHGWQAPAWDSVTEASALLMTSEMEGFPIVLLEAIARGVPLVAMDCDFGPREIIDDKRNGWLVPKDDIEAFARVLEGLCNGTLVSPSIESVRATSQMFSASQVVGRIEEAILSAASMRSRRPSVGRQL